jgi:hypothetical protein
MFKFGLINTNKLFSSLFSRLLYTKKHYWQMTDQSSRGYNRKFKLRNINTNQQAHKTKKKSVYEQEYSNEYTFLA